MYRSDFSSAASLDLAAIAGALSPARVSSKTKAKTTTKTV
jgi:hypothetical protein